MAKRPRKVKTKVEQIQEPKYYAYYNQQTGALISVSSELSTIHEYGIEISFEKFERLITGVDRFSDYAVGPIVNEETTVIGLIPLYDEPQLDFKNNLFVWIHELSTSKSDVIVKWHGNTAHWEFIANGDSCKKRIIDRTVPSNISFYVLLESDFDFLIRTITIPSTNLLMGIHIPFESKFEYDISKISIASKSVFYNYGLEIINE